MDSIITFGTKQKSALLCFFLLLVFTLIGCSAKDDKHKEESQKKSVKQDEGLRKVEEDIAQNHAERKAHTSAVRKKETEDSNQNIIDRAFTKLDSLTDADQKIELVAELSEQYPGFLVTIVDKAFNDKDPEVRLAAIELLVDCESPGKLAVVSRALKDADEQIREVAVESLASVKDPEVSKLLVQAIGDKSESVRTAAMTAAEEQEGSTMLDVLQAGISSPYNDVKEEVVSALLNLGNRDAIDILILGLKDSDDEFREDVSSTINVLISQEFNSYEEAKKWWDSNRNRYDDELFEKEAQE
jgi:HEAT repeat protein